MNRTEYLGKLAAQIATLPDEEITRSLAFYSEAIDDRMEAGLSEEEAVAQLEPPAVAARTIIEELPIVPRAVAVTRRRSETLFLALAIIGSPIWLSLAIGVVGAAAGIYIAIWAMVFALWAIVICFVAGPLLGIGVLLWNLATTGFTTGAFANGLWQFGIGLVLGGLGLLLIRPTIAATRGLAGLSARWIKAVAARFVRRDAAAPAATSRTQAPTKPLTASDNPDSATIAGTIIAARNAKAERIWRTVFIAAPICIGAGIVVLVAALAINHWGVNQLVDVAGTLLADHFVLLRMLGV